MYSLSCDSCPLPTNESFLGSHFRSTDPIVVEINGGDLCIAQLSVFYKSYDPLNSDYYIFTSCYHLGNMRNVDITNIAKYYQFIN